MRWERTNCFGFMNNNHIPPDLTSSVFNAAAVVSAGLNLLQTCLTLNDQCDSYYPDLTHILNHVNNILL